MSRLGFEVGFNWGGVFSFHSSLCFFPHRTFVHLCSLGSWTALLARAVVTGLLALSTLALYVAVVNVHS